MELQNTIQALPDNEFRDLKAWIVTTETDRRAAQPAVEQAKQEAEAETATKITQQLSEEHPELVQKPTPETDTAAREWEPWHPLKESTHYRYGDKTRHKDKTWRDVLDPTRTTLNVWEPGAPGIDERYWVEETEPETAPETGDAPETDTEMDNAPETEDTGVQAWAPNLNVTPGQRYTFQGDTYEVVQAHTTQTGWKPSAVPALYKRV